MLPAVTDWLITQMNIPVIRNIAQHIVWHQISVARRSWGRVSQANQHTVNDIRYVTPSQPHTLSQLLQS